MQGQTIAKSIETLFHLKTPPTEGKSRAQNLNSPYKSGAQISLSLNVISENWVMHPLVSDPPSPYLTRVDHRFE